jgi:vacuolar protein sorting-associated protein IST1
MPFNENRLKVQLKLAINRLKMLQSKKQSINQQQRRELATLMENGKVESARIRVEHVIREDYHMEAMEVLELLCELLLARSALLATSSANPSSSSSPMDPTLMEAVQTIIFAATRCEGAKELMQVPGTIVHTYSLSIA